MEFNHFRLVIVFLASFGAFFAYVARLNLSLTINHMAKTEKSNASELSAPALFRELEKDMPFIFRTEEHTIALVDQVVQWTSPVYRPSNVSESPKRWRGFKTSNGLAPLAIEVDVAPKPSEANTSSTSDVTQVNIGETGGTKLNWSNLDKERLIGAFFCGYVFSQIPAARAAEIFGAKSLFLVSGLGAALCSLVFPFVCKLSESTWPAWIVRMIMGFTQGALFPSCYVLFCEWLPPNERSKWLPYPSSFSRLGTIVMNLTIPLVVKSLGWEYSYYIIGVASLGWCILFFVFASDTPARSGWLSREELVHIESRMEPRVGTQRVAGALAKEAASSTQSLDEPGVWPTTSQQASTKPSVSWPKLVSNRALALLALIMFASEWSNFLLLIRLPSYLGDVFKMDIQDVGFLGSVLVAIYCVQYPLSSLCASKMEACGFASLTVRKFFEATAHLSQALSCLVIAYSDNLKLVMAALALMMLGRATVGGGQCLMPPELSKEYPGTVFAYANTLANVAGIMGPEVVASLVRDSKDHASWFTFWVLSAALMASVALIFCLFGDNSAQNLSRKVTTTKTTSELNLTRDKNPVQEIFKMDAFARVFTEPETGAPAPRPSPKTTSRRESAGSPRLSRRKA